MLERSPRFLLVYELRALGQRDESSLLLSALKSGTPTRSGGLAMIRNFEQRMGGPQEHLSPCGGFRTHLTPYQLEARQKHYEATCLRLCSSLLNQFTDNPAFRQSFQRRDR